MKCPTCEGTGKQTITARTLTDKGWQDEPPVDIECITCDGACEITEERAKKLQEMHDAWCRCGNPSRQGVPYDYGTCHGVECYDCGKLLQTG